MGASSTARIGSARVAGRIRAVETGYDYLMVVKAAQVMNVKATPAH
jgi:hypothetical protein